MTSAYSLTITESLTNQWYQYGFKHKLSRFQKGKARLIKKMWIIQDDTYSLSVKWHVACRISEAESTECTYTGTSVVYIGYQIIFITKLKKSDLRKFRSRHTFEAPFIFFRWKRGIEDGSIPKWQFKTTWTSKVLDLNFCCKKQFMDLRKHASNLLAVHFFCFVGNFSKQGKNLDIKKKRNREGRGK